MLTKLGKYEIRREIGRGAMGVVYEGFDPFIERTVAIKTILKSKIDNSESREIFKRFRREAQAAGRLSHPNIVSIFEYGEDDDMAFIAMELISGIELKEYFDKAKRFEIPDAASIMMQLLDAIEYSHNRGVVHRDIKPSNILLTKDGKIKIADFGIAKIESSDLTQVGTVMGTPSYMPPEQFLGQVSDRRSDIYAAGVILYQLLTGERPFTGSNMTIIMHKVLNQAPVPPSQLNNRVSKALDEVVRIAISKRPEDRFQTAAAFMAALQLALKSTGPSDRGTDIEETVKIIQPIRNQEIAGTRLGSILNFDLGDLDKRLDERRSEMNEITTHPADEKDKIISALLMDSSAVASASPHEASESSLLAKLEQEKTSALQSTERDRQKKSRQVHDAMNAIVKFFTPFIQHVNKVQPEIGRVYHLDDRTKFTHLKWVRATLDCRKQDLSESAFLEHVTFSVNLCAPEPVLVKRTWEQLEELKTELSNLRLRTLEDLDEIGKSLGQQSAESHLLPNFLRRKMKSIEARLAPDFILQIRFQGNYQQGYIDVSSSNIEAFGIVSFKIEPADVTSKLLDDLGLFLLGRTGELPSGFQRIQ